MKATQQNFILGLWGVRYQVKSSCSSLLDAERLPAVNTALVPYLDPG